MRWKTNEEQVLEQALASKAMGAEERIQALFDMVDFVVRMLTDTGRLVEKLRLLDQVEEEGHERYREWVRRNRA